MMTEAPTVRLQRVMPATPEVVFDEWLDPESLRGVDVSTTRIGASPSPSNRRSAGACASTSTTRETWF